MNEDTFLHLLTYYANQATDGLPSTNTVRKELATEHLGTKLGSDTIHTGAGLGHMTGLLQMVEHSNTAGQNIPKIVLRNTKGNTNTIHSQTDIRTILEIVANNENIIESCHNEVMSEHQKETLKWQDSSLPFETRKVAAEAARQILINYKTLLQNKIANFDPEALPTELPELKAVLIERLEATALKHIKYLRGVSTQQGIDLPATCPESATAEQSIASFVYKGALLINRAEDVATAKRFADLYKGNIRKVKVANSPFFTLLSQSAPLGSLHSVRGRSVSLLVKQLSTQPPDALQVAVAKGAATLSLDKTAPHQLKITLTATTAGSVELEARNLCGPTKQVVIFE